MRFTKIPTDTFKQIVLNAGILVDSFDMETNTIGNIIGATSGGIQFTATPTFKDFGEDIDNCPKNTMELKKLDDVEAKLSGNFATVTVETAQLLVGAADISTTNATLIVPRREILTTDFKTVWLITDYSDFNGETNGGYAAIHMMNTLSTGGFQMQTTDKEKGKFAFEFTAHYSMAAQNVVPYEVYIKSGTAEPGV